MGSGRGGDAMGAQPMGGCSCTRPQPRPTWFAFSGQSSALPACPPGPPRLRHPNVVALLDVLEIDTDTFAMMVMDGLPELVKQGLPPPGQGLQPPGLGTQPPAQGGPSSGR